MRSFRTLAVAVGVALVSIVPVAHAATLDLTTGQTDVPFAGALFTSGSSTANVGTGVFGTFVQVGTSSGHQDVTRGYNTTVNGVLDNGQSDNFNHAITFLDVSTVSAGGTRYRQFDLDINEANNASSRYLSVDDIELYLSDVANQSTPDVSALGTRIYDLDQGGDNNVLLDYNLNHGSGKGIDMVFLVPDRLFTGPSRFVYLYSKFGGEGDTSVTTDTRVFTQSAGFEEWSSSACVDAPNAPCAPVSREQLPEPATPLLIGLALAGLAGLRRKARRAA